MKFKFLRPEFSKNGIIYIPTKMLTWCSTRTIRKTKANNYTHKIDQSIMKSIYKTVIFYFHRCLKFLDCLSARSKDYLFPLKCTYCIMSDWQRPVVTIYRKDLQGIGNSYESWSRWITNSLIHFPNVIKISLKWTKLYNCGFGI